MTGPTLPEWLLACIDDDEAVARAAYDEPNEYLPTGWMGRERLVTDADLDETSAAHIIRFDPARVLAECETKRRIVEPWSSLLVDEDDWRYGTHSPAHDHVLRLLALLYADRPGYRDEWRP